ncbi:hypothetical protein EF847_14915 [Actinobacteria bacterium YIM 96077]|uniref:Uncharacterized protein n=1 Tax=Phytoactinopolyspora halophila TaxID=1981511 RepID=A0A329QTS7_9ACTN|nr:hypothetical protein [Phytoactinopolyspora halophila]AYY13794.1 hypothetical protein EF847_14915 [Actinobacteria bacterium YIM 96077]RAW15663.1 hypothetical protein DPM12_08425 [Phytoactinopolyspora halophila]
MFGELRRSWTEARPVDRIAYRIGAALIVSGAFHFGVWVISGDAWDGPVSWRKATTFGLSFGLTLITVVWVSSFLCLSSRERKVLIGTFAAVCTLETALVTMQVWRGTPSHFNQETTFDTAVSRALAAGGAVIVIVIATLTVMSFRANPTVERRMRLALRMGFIALDLSLLIGAAMIVEGVTQVYAGNQHEAYEVAGFLKPGHAATMHGILILPALAWLTSFTGWPESRRDAFVHIGVAGYALFAVAIIIDSFSGLGAIAYVVAGLGGLLLLGAGVLTIAAVIRASSVARAGGLTNRS